MKPQFIRYSLLSCCLVSTVSHAGFFDAINDASKALETFEEVIETPAQTNNEPQQPAHKPKNSPSQKTASSQQANAKPATTINATNTATNNDFVNYTNGRIKLPYDQCPTTDILGIKLGQNISEVMPDSPFYFRKPQDSDSPTFPNTSATNSFEEYTVFSPEFESLRLDSINRTYHYGFDQSEYNKIKDLDMQGARHGLSVWIDLKKGKEHPLIKDKHATYINLILDVNGDINSISAQRTLPVKISKSNVEDKLKAKYGEKRAPKDKNNQVIYISTWGARVDSRIASIMSVTAPSEKSEQSIIDYQLSCVVAKRASKAHHKKLRKKWKEIAESMRDNSGVSVDI